MNETLFTKIGSLDYKHSLPTPCSIVYHCEYTTIYSSSLLMNFKVGFSLGLITHSAAVNILVCVFVNVSTFLLGMFQEVGLLG